MISMVVITAFRMERAMRALTRSKEISNSKHELGIEVAIRRF